jgi:hypothetical protein
MSFDIAIASLKSKRPNAERMEAIRAVFNSWSAPPPDEFGCVLVPLGQSQAVELFGFRSDGKPPSAMMAARGFDLTHARLLYELAAAGELAIIPVAESSLVIIVRAEHAKILDDGMEELELLEARSPEDILKIIEGDFEDWAGYRDRVIESDQSGVDEQ